MCCHTGSNWGNSDEPDLRTPEEKEVQRKQSQLDYDERKAEEQRIIEHNKLVDPDGSKAQAYEDYKWKLHNNAITKMANLLEEPAQPVSAEVQVAATKQLNQIIKDLT